jgi:hypothetical protein
LGPDGPAGGRVLAKGVPSVHQAWKARIYRGAAYSTTTVIRILGWIPQVTGNVPFWVKGA